MIVLDSGTTRSRAASRSTGNLPIGQTASNSAREASLERSISLGSKAMPFSYSGISTFQQNDDSGW